jgi:PEP-CTERM motif
MRFGLKLWLVGIVTGMTLNSAVQAIPLGYKFDVTTFYQFGVPADLTYSDFGVASPDTGYWRVTNSGSTAFSGTIGQSALSNFGGDFSYSHAVSLAPGTSVVFAVNSESSNFGGYNGAFDTDQNGVEIYLTGLIEGLEAVDLHVFDKDIHSGVPRVNPFGEILDSYVLSGGSARGFDTGDDFEVTQAPGLFTFFEVGPTGVPEPGTLALLSVGLMGFGRRFRRS